MNDQELIGQLNRIIVSTESGRIVAQKRGDLENEKELRSFRSGVEEIRDKIAAGNYDETIKEQALQVISQHLNKDGNPGDLLGWIIDKIFRKSKKEKDEDNNPIKK